MRTSHDPPDDDRSYVPPDDPPKTNRLLTVKDAATVLGISPEAVRARLKRGTLDRETGEDGTVYVRLDADPPSDGADGAHNRTDNWTGDRTGRTNGWTGEPGMLVERMASEIDHLRDQLDKEREANRENRRLLAAALERIPALDAAPDTPSDGIPDERGDPETTSEDWGNGEGRPEQEKHSWWRRLFG